MVMADNNSKEEGKRKEGKGGREMGEKGAFFSDGQFVFFVLMRCRVQMGKD